MSDFDYLPDIQSALQADVTLVAALPGGIRLQRDLGGKLTRALLPGVYDSTGFIRPVLFIKGRAVLPFGGKDPANQFQITRQVVEFWFYQDRSNAWTALRTAANRLYALVNDKPFAGATKLHFANELEWNDPELNYACTIRHDYTLIGSRSV